MKNYELFIYVKETFKRADGTTFEMERILPNYFKVKLSEKTDIKEYIKHMTTKNADMIEELCNDDLIHSLSVIKRELEVVSVKKSRWGSGEYYAHEYDKYTEGRRRKWTYSNGYVEWEIECLDKSLNVFDGISDEESGNGCGDYFYG